jgi:hypothetical protein
MDLSNIKPAAGAVKRKNRLGRGEGTGSGGTAGRGHKELNRVLDTNVKLDLKVVRCLFKDVSPSLVLRIRSVLNTMLST